MSAVEQPARATCDVCGTEQAVTQKGALRKHKAGATGADRSLPCTGSGTLIGPARIPRRSVAGFYRCHVTGEYLRSVTTILNQGSPKEALIHWAGNLVAETAIEHLPYLVKSSRSSSSREEAYDWLRRAHTRKRDERADLGTAVHALIEAHVLGTPPPTDLVDDPEFAPFIEHFRRFVADFEVEFTASEMVVANYDAAYAGTLDYMFRSPVISRIWGLPLDTEYMGDTKTGGELDKKGVYAEAGLQQAGYRRGQYCWLRDGTRVPMPLAHEVGIVLHLRPEGYRAVPVRCGDDLYAAFQSVRAVADFNTELAPHVVGDALTPGSKNTTRNEAA